MQAADATTVDIQQQRFIQDVVAGLSQSQKQLPAKYFYDDRGSKLFDAICELPEYYPYRTELALLPRVCADLSSLLPDQCDIIEFGAGSLVKIRLLLEHLNGSGCYVPIDIAADHLNSACQSLQQEYPGLEIEPVAADFTREVQLPELSQGQKLGFFPGSTIGNFSPTEAATFLRNARLSLGPDGMLLIGVDTKKDPGVLHQAYNDAQGVTAAFNQNILTRIKRELDAEISTEQFSHYAFYNIPAGRVEMHLVSQADQIVTIADHQFAFTEGESIHTENSHKYTSAEFAALAQDGGWRVVKYWSDTQGLFSEFLLAPIECSL